MTREDIKSELIKRVNDYLLNHTDRSNTINGLSNRLSSFDKSLEKIDEILVELLKENNINYKDDEVKKEFIEFIKPTVFELTKKIVQN